MKQTRELNSETKLQYQVKVAEAADHDPFFPHSAFPHIHGHGEILVLHPEMNELSTSSEGCMLLFILHRSSSSSNWPIYPDHNVSVFL